MIDFIFNFLESEGFSMIKLPDGNGLGTRLEGNGIDYSFVIWVDEKEHEVIIYSTFFFNIDQKVMPNIMELVTMINFGMVIGNFELDITDGELKFKTSTTYDSNVGIPESVLKDLVYLNIASMDKYYPSVQAVIDGETNLKKVVEQIS